MAGLLALHGGAEFQRPDDAFLTALLRATAVGAALAGADRGPLRVALVTTATAKHDPGATFAIGASALERLARKLGLRVAVEEARAIDAASAADREIASRIARADLVHVPGGDPDVVLDVLGGSAALDAIRSAWRRGAAVAGASAGAMAFGRVTWTPGGMRTGFGWAGDLLVVPHADEARMDDAVRQRASMGEPRVGLLGLAECTGVIRDGNGRWRVEGIGHAWWVPAGGRVATTYGPGERIEVSAAPGAAA